jgi:hypothetical protein
MVGIVSLAADERAAGRYHARLHGHLRFNRGRGFQSLKERCETAKVFSFEPRAAGK